MHGRLNITRARMRILGLERRRLDREIHMHEREIERLRDNRRRVNPEIESILRIMVNAVK